MRISRLPWFETRVNCDPGRLKDITDPTKIAHGQTIEGRMQGVCKNAAEDIKECANTCDTYLKSVIIGSVLFALTPSLERRLL